MRRMNSRTEQKVIKIYFLIKWALEMNIKIKLTQINFRVITNI